LLRMRPLSISYAEGFVVISCGKSHLLQIWLARRLTLDVATVYER
jgi:hypothetical protein